MLGVTSHVDVQADPATEQRIGRTKYTYDANYRLTRVDYPGAAGWEGYTYDGIGNRTSLFNQYTTSPTNTT